MDDSNHTYIIDAAGGNPTAIKVLYNTLARAEYEALGSALMRETEDQGVEQAGFLVLPDFHFEMGGGEFCGNAARAAAMLFSRLMGEEQFLFTMSGYAGDVEASVNWISDTVADVTCTFTDLPSEVENVTVMGGAPAKVVDLGGIVHVLIEASFPKDEYEEQHRLVTEELGFQDRPAVGVNWTSVSAGKVELHPVVWVRAIDSFFYETACGSGSIAAHAATGAEDIVQPSGLSIKVYSEDNKITLQSIMEIRQ